MQEETCRLGMKGEVTLAVSYLTVFQDSGGWPRVSSPFVSRPAHFLCAALDQKKKRQTCSTFCRSLVPIFYCLPVFRSDSSKLAEKIAKKAAEKKAKDDEEAARVAHSVLRVCAFCMSCSSVFKACLLC